MRVKARAFSTAFPRVVRGFWVAATRSRFLRRLDRMSFIGPAAGGAILRCVAPRLTVSDSLCAEAHRTNKHQCSMARGACTPLPGAQLPGPACGQSDPCPKRALKQAAKERRSPYPHHATGMAALNPPPSPLPTSPKQDGVPHRVLGPGHESRHVVVSLFSFCPSLVLP